MSIDRFIWKQSDVIKPLCWKCKHLKTGGKCDAFPSGIPEQFLSGEKEHIEPFTDDNGIQFESLMPLPE